MKAVAPLEVRILTVARPIPEAPPIWTNEAGQELHQDPSLTCHNSHLAFQTGNVFVSDLERRHSAYLLIW